MCLPCLLTRHNLLTVGFVPTMHWWHWRRSNRMCHFSLRKVGRRVPIVTSWHRDIVTRGHRGILLGEFWIVSAESRFRSLNCASLICYASSMTSCTETSHGPAPSCFTNGLVICYDVLKWHGYDTYDCTCTCTKYTEKDPGQTRAQDILYASDCVSARHWISLANLMELPPDLADRYFQTFAKEIVPYPNFLAWAGRHSEVLSNLSMVASKEHLMCRVVQRCTLERWLKWSVRCYSSLDEAEKCLEYTPKSVEVSAAEKWDEIYCDLLSCCIH